MIEPKTKLQQGIDYLAKHRTGARTAELAKALDCETRNVGVILKPAIDAGLIVTCKIERPNQQPCNEYKLSASAPEGQDIPWREFRISLKPAKPLKPAAPRPPRVHEVHRPGPKNQLGNAEQPKPGVGSITPAVAHRTTSLAKNPAEGATVIETQAASHGAEATVPAVADPAASDVRLNLHLAIDANGHLTIGELTFDPATTRAIGEFLIDTEPVWA